MASVKGGLKSQEKKREKKPVKKRLGRAMLTGSTEGWKGPIFFGLLFVAGSIAILLAGPGLGALASEPQRHAVALVGFSILFGLGSLTLFANVPTFLLWIGRRHRLKRYASEPWFIDFPWHRTDARHSAGREAFSRLAGMTCVTLFLLPLNLLMPWFPVIWAFDALALWGWGVAVYRYLQGVKYGGTRLRFAKTPFVLGGRFEAFLSGLDRLRDFKSLTVTLRCIKMMNGDSGEPELPYIVYEDRRELGPRDVVFGLGEAAGLLQVARKDDPHSELRLEFPLPQKGLGTRLDHKMPRHWELEVVADTPGVDFRALFLVPIYTREEAGPQAQVETRKSFYV